MSTVEFRTLDDGHWVTLDDGQHVFIRGGRVFASMAAINEAARQHSVRAGTTLGDAVIAKAKSEGVHPDHLRAAVDAVHQRHKDETEELHQALTAARKQTGLDSRRISQWEERGKDHSSYPGLDVKARELADAFPVLGLGRGYSAESGEDEGGHAAALWELLSKPAAQPLPRHDPEILDRAAELVHQANRGQALRSKPVRSPASPRWDTRARSRAEDVPFSAPLPPFWALFLAWVAAGKPEEFDLARFAAARRTPPVRAILQGIHDIAAAGGPVCGTAPSAAEFARPSIASRGLRAIHDLAAAGGAVCRSQPRGG